MRVNTLMNSYRRIHEEAKKNLPTDDSGGCLVEVTDTCVTNISKIVVS